jgi:hypothetical protein
MKQLSRERRVFTRLGTININLASSKISFGDRNGNIADLFIGLVKIDNLTTASNRL